MGPGPFNAGAGSFTGYFDTAQVTLYAFWIFFAGLIFYIRREDKREGYPLESDRTNSTDRVEVQGYPPVPEPKVFHLYDGDTTEAPNTEPPDVPHDAVPAADFPGAPLQPLGNPMLDAVGPASYVHRLDVPAVSFKGTPKIVPMRLLQGYSFFPESADPRGMEVAGADGQIAGIVSDVWIDEIEKRIRYLEVETDVTPDRRHVLLPDTFVRYNTSRRRVTVRSILAAQFADVPGLRNPDVITLREEDHIVGYYGGGTLYAAPARLGPVL